MSQDVRFERLELEYGCHSAGFDLSKRGAPFVILGPNGCGKTTILEALLRTLYGFSRRKPKERTTFEERRPWGGGAYRAAVELEGPEGRLLFARDFETDEVRVMRRGEAEPVFEGEANPAGTGEKAREYRRLLRRALGLPDLDAYDRTASVTQGGLLRTTLSEDILQIAAGGHADVESARETLRDRYYAITVEPISPDERKRRRAGEIERLHRQREELRGRAEQARAAEARRAPLARRRDEIRVRLAHAEADVSTLEAAFEGLSELESLRAAHDAAQERLRQLEELRRELDEALAHLDLFERRVGLDSAYASFPDDYLERLGALLDGLWPHEHSLVEECRRHRERLDRIGTPGPISLVGLVAGLLAALVGGLLFRAGSEVGGALILLIGAGAAGFAGVGRSRRRRSRRREGEVLEDAERRLEEVRERIRRRLESVPEAASLTPETLPDRRRAFERDRAEQKMVEEARVSLRSLMDRAGAALERAETARGTEPDAEASGPRSATRDERLLDRTRELLSELAAAASLERDEKLAPLKLQLRDASRSSFALPDGVPAESAAVRARLRARREELRRAQEELTAAERRLAYEGRPAESSLSIRSRLAELDRRDVALRRTAEAYRHAFRLVSEAYEEFRRTDQERLVDSVSRYLARATRGDLGPLVAPAGLESARLDAGGRIVPLSSPPLSYGQLHSTLFAIRLAAADFLADLGIRVPLLVDDPFVHLDEERARELWNALSRLAKERQIVVATQDRLLLEHLEVRPDLRLAARSISAAELAERPGAPAVERATEPEPPGREEAATLDLWGSQPPRGE